MSVRRGGDSLSREMVTEAEGENEMENESSDSVDSSSSGDDEEEDDDGMIGEDEEMYVKFVRSVFCDDYSGCSNTDEDDEEDYEPDNKDDDCDDDEDDRDLIRVQNRELRELVDGCWQTIVGEAPNISSIPMKEDFDDEPSSFGAAPLAELPEPASPPSKGSTSVFDQMDEDLDFSLLSPVPALAKYYPPAAGGPVPTHSTSEPVKAKPATSAISTMVTKLFLENDTSEAHVEGMPVHACRKLVARQMSMATQLLVQILLQADDRSESFTKGFSSLMELSNLREAALKKASLIQMNFNNATTIRNHTLDLRQQKLRGEGNSSAGSANDGAAESSDSDNDYGMRPYLTKGLARSNKERELNGTAALIALSSAGEESLLDAYSCGTDADSEEQQNRSTDFGKARSSRRLTRSATIRDSAVRSMFNVPILAKVSTLFDMIDLSRRNIKNRVNALGGNASSKIPGLSGEKRTISGASEDQSAQVRVHTLHAIKEQMYTIMPQLNMRAWRCLLPNALYPLPANLIRTLDPSTLTGRCLFTPTEDDLLLRGIMSTTESSWDQIKSFYVPSKEAQLLQFRYTQMTSISALEENNFKRYQKLSNDYRDRDHKWTHTEELELLKGFQAFGERWPLVRLFHLPHRRSPQIRAKWFALQKVWQKAFQSQNYKSGAMMELPEAMRIFLGELNQPSLERVRNKISALQKRQLDEQAHSEGSSAQSSTISTSSSGIQAQNPLTSTLKSVGLPAAPLLGQSSVLAFPRAEGGSCSQNNNTSFVLPSIPQVSSQSMSVAVPMSMGGMGNMMSVPQMPGMGGQPTQQAYPGFTMPPFMMPPWVPPGGKMPTTPAEFQAYQQSYQQYQQFMMYQYQMYMISQQQQMQMQVMQSGLAPPGAHSMNGQFTNGSMHTGSATLGPIASTTSAPFNNQGQQATSLPPKSSFSDFDASGPPLLRETVQEKSKRSRKYGGVDSISSPTATSSLSTPAKSAQAVEQTTAGTTAQSPVPVSDCIGDASNGASFWHDQDSIFSLLMPGNSIPFGDQGMSVPMVDSESGASNSISREGSLLSRVKAANAAAPLSSRVSLAESLKAASNNTLATSASVAGLSAGPVDNNGTGIKGILLKPKKKTIKPTLISSTLVSGATDMSRASPAFAASTTNSNTFQTVRNKHGVLNAPPSISSETIGQSNSIDTGTSRRDNDKTAVEEQSLLGFEGFSNMNWSSAQRDCQDSLHSPLLEDISMMDASKFGFSMPFRPTRASIQGQKPTGQKRGSSEKSDNSGQENIKSGYNKKAKKGPIKEPSNNNAPNSVSLTTSTPVAAGSVQSEPGNVFAFDETSNMSLLGDVFNDGDGTGGHGFSNLTNLLSLSSPIRGRGNKSRGKMDSAVTGSTIGVGSPMTASDERHSDEQNELGPSSKKQRIGGIFAEVMATANKKKP